MSNIPKGYKQTEVGVIPSDREVKKLGEITISVASGRSNTSSEIGNYPIYGSTGIIGYKKSKDYEGDKILVARVGANAGTVNRVNGVYCVSDNTLMITYPRNVNMNFSYYQLVNYKLNKIIFGSGQPLITGSQIKNLKIPLPPTQAEQTAIATALCDADALINRLEELIAKKRNIKQGAMQELLTGKKRLPGFSGEWELKKLGEILRNPKLGGNYLNTETETSLPLIKMGNIGRGNIALDNIEYIPENNIPSEKDKLHYGDVLFNTRNTIDLVGKVAVWKNELPLAYYNSNLMKLEFNPTHVSSNFFMNYIFNTSALLAQLKGIVTGTTSVAAIYTRDLLNVKIPLPTKSEQTAIAQILSDMDAEIEQLEQKLDKYKIIKQGMMQELLTGETRLI